MDKIFAASFTTPKLRASAWTRRKKVNQVRLHCHGKAKVPSHAPSATSTWTPHHWTHTTGIARLVQQEVVVLVLSRGRKLVRCSDGGKFQRANESKLLCRMARIKIFLQSACSHQHVLEPPILGWLVVTQRLLSPHRTLLVQTPAARGNLALKISPGCATAAARITNERERIVARNAPRTLEITGV